MYTSMAAHIAAHGTQTGVDTMLSPLSVWTTFWLPIANRLKGLRLPDGSQPAHRVSQRQIPAGREAQRLEH